MPGWSASVRLANTTIGPDLAAFISGLDMFYLGTANAEGQPYIQYRGGSPGFLKVIDEHTLGFADFGGNQQYVTLGNLSENPKAFIFLMDYANSQRIKLWGTAQVIDNDPDPARTASRSLTTQAKSNGQSFSPSRPGTPTARNISTNGIQNGRSAPIIDEA